MLKMMNNQDQSIKAKKLADQKDCLQTGLSLELDFKLVASEN